MPQGERIGDRLLDDRLERDRLPRHDDGAGLPCYDDLPRDAVIGYPHAWDVFGRDDNLGTLNLLTDEVVLAALAEARTGQRVSLTLEASALDPPLYGRASLTHTLIQSTRNVWDDKLDEFYPQASSQWDGFRHVRARELGFWGGLTADPPELGDRLGIEHFAERGIIGRGVLLDVEHHLRTRSSDYDPLEEVPISADVLREVAEAQRVQLRRGDILCLRFGWMQAYRGLDATARASYAAAGHGSRFAGLSAEESMARALWDLHVAAVACDNPGAEVSPGDAATGSLHRRLLPLLGIVVGELLDFEELAVECERRDSWSFLFTSVPLNVAGAVGSPANAVAVL